MDSYHDKMRKILDDQKNIANIAISYFNVKIIEEFYDPELFNEIRQISMYTARKAYNSLHLEANKENIREKMPEVPTYSLENNINLEHIDTSLKMSSFLTISKSTIDTVLNVIRIKRMFMNEGMNDIDDVNTNITIYGYYASACFAKDFCKNKKVYNYMKHQSIEAYKELKDENSRKILLQYVDKDFLNIK